MMNVDTEREKLFNEVWKEPMITVAKRYGLSDNGLRKRCTKLEIPLPPVGHWAKLQAGKESTPQPKLSTLKLTQQKMFDKETKQYQIIELIDVENKSSKELKEIDGIELLTPESKERFLKWCSNIQVPKRIDNYNPLIIEYQNEIEYRRSRDEEHKFRDIFKYFFSMMMKQSKIQYRNNKAVLSISVSDKEANRAFRIMDTLINLINELDGKVTVESGEKDNAFFRLFKHTFTFQMTEIMVKRRSLLSNCPDENIAVDFRPLYEKVPSGLFKIEFRELISDREGNKTEKTLSFEDSIDVPIEKQLGQVFMVLFKAVNEAKIARYIDEREYEKKEKEQQCLREIEEENRKKLRQIEEQNRRKQHLVQNIEQQMEGWFKSQKLRKYAEQIEEYAATSSDETTKELLTIDISIVRNRAEDCDPVTDIINEVKAITSLNG